VSNPGRQTAYTLFELLMTLALAAMILSVGIPTFGSLVADNRLRTQLNSLFHAVHLARKESITRRRVVSICPSADGQNCSPTFDWSAGWIMFANESRHDELTRSPTEPLLRYQKGDAQTVILANRRGFSLRSTELRATNGTLVFCDPENRTEARALVISYTGRPRVTRKDRRGRPFSCAH